MHHPAERRVSSGPLRGPLAVTVAKCRLPACIAAKLAREPGDVPNGVAAPFTTWHAHNRPAGVTFGPAPFSELAIVLASPLGLAGFASSMDSAGSGSSASACRKLCSRPLPRASLLPTTPRAVRPVISADMSSCVTERPASSQTDPILAREKVETFFLRAHWHAAAYLI